jgi:6-phosphogluconolactonase (cycloisomerase 2 family)
MRTSWKLAAITLGGAAAAALSVVPAGAATTQTGNTASAGSTARAGNTAPVVFVQTDATSGNTVVAYDRTASGGLKEAGSYPTGGDGGIQGGSVVDHLSSEGSLAYDKNAGLLYAVNAGSDTVTVFAVRGDRLTRLQVISSGGQFPASVAFRGDQVYVLNAAGGGSVSGYLRAGGFLVPIPAWHRSLGLNPDQTPEFTSTPGQIGFTPDGTHLVVTTKNGGNTVDVFPVGLAGPSARPTVTSLPGTVPYGFTLDSYGHLALVEAGPNAIATFSIARDGELTQLGSVATGQAATCWVTAADGTLYASNAGSGTVSVVHDDAAGGLTASGTAATGAGTVDATASGDGRYLYVQTGGAGDVDAFRIGPDGALTETGSVTVPGAVGGEGIAAS